VALLATAAAPAVGSAEAGSERERRTRELLDEHRACVASGSEGIERQTRLRQELVLANVSVATSIALRYRGRGEPFEDLAQCAYLGLVNAANGFDPRRGPDFLSYAVPTVAGEVKRPPTDAWCRCPASPRSTSSPPTPTRTDPASPRPGAPPAPEAPAGTAPSITHDPQWAGRPGRRTTAGSARSRSTRPFGLPGADRPLLQE
jgi:hypothetical protein